MSDKISFYALMVCFVAMIYTAFVFYPKWNQTRTEATISWDASGYYMYLPAIFIYKDIKKCGFRDSIISKYQPTPDFQQAFLHEKSGNYVMKYASGQALAMLPWFWVGHTWAAISEIYPDDGFSYPYQASIGIGLFLYALIGLYYLRKILLFYFSDETTSITLLLLVLGTNYLNYAAIDLAMTHSTLFTLYVFIIWNTIRYYQKPDRFRIILIGLLCGFATLIRPTEIISCLIPILWGISSVAQAKERWNYFIQNFSIVLIFGISFFAVAFIQPLYWKWVANEWLVYSYQDQGFSWLSPHVKDYLLSYRCGWLRYSPLMILPFVGMIPFYKGKINHAVLLFIILSLYIVTAWDIWDYGGTAGRAMVQYYPLLVLPLATLVAAANESKWAKYIFYPFAILFAYLGIWWVYQAHRGHVQVLEVSREYYWKKIGRWSSNEADTKLLDNKYSYEGVTKNPNVIYENHFDSDTSANRIDVDGNIKIKLDQSLQFTSGYDFSNPVNGQKWVRVFATFKSQNKEWDLWKQAQFIVKFYLHDQEVQGNYIRVFRFLGDNEEKEIYLDAKLPKEWTKARIAIWNADSDKTLMIDDIKVISFDE